MLNAVCGVQPAAAILPMKGYVTRAEAARVKEEFGQMLTLPTSAQVVVRGSGGLPVTGRSRSASCSRALRVARRVLFSFRRTSSSGWRTLLQSADRLP